ncbi:MAG: hypothetical protein ACR2NY_00190 [Alphaproteobacteria bacterium]
MTMLVGCVNFFKTAPIKWWRGLLMLGLFVSGWCFPIDSHAADATVGITEVEDEIKGLPQFEATTFPSQLFWLIISFGIFFFLISKFFAPKINQRLDLRSRVIKNNIDTADGFLKRGKKIEQDLEKKLAIAHTNARAEITKTTAIITNQQEAALKKFQKKSDTAITQSNNLLQKITSDINQEKADIIANIKKEIVKKILS